MRAAPYARILLAALCALALATSASAGTGWYLMWPPPAADGRPMLTAPLRTWQQEVRRG
jgi:hypothetical protein